MPDGKTLYVMRHAEAAWPSSRHRDFDRPLDLQGERDASAMGKRLRAHGSIPDLMISSPARRAEQTAKLIAKELKIEFHTIVFEASIYEAGVSNLLDIIQALDDRYQSAMLIGHNPSLTWVINQLTGEHIANAPTCSIATLRTFSPRWVDTVFETSELLKISLPHK